ncbi:capsular biosynthesis protein [Xylophilus rhododendri]|uniref:Capsular biosynthesis protein n=1 Tax=Xylophilus rhododendri TaxID=2697032 RepID=A0A857J7B9_9BURK|nr:capsular biosynthesis protein [Xylophilus rhododendri]QHI99874.1 capsular biosynthesis protein [Xylophilus rhododendri]
MRWTGVFAAAGLVLPFWLAACAQAQPVVPAPAFVQDGAGVPFFRFAVDEDGLGGAPDRSAMNRPLDAASRIVAHDGHFFSVGADGKAGGGDDQRVRLFGVNLSFAANFPSDIDAVKLAKRLRKLGFNAVRLHHMDSAPDTRANPPRSVLLPGPFPTFNPEALMRLRRLIEALSAEGLYVDLNLRVGYRFRPTVDQVPPMDGGAAAAPYTAPIYIYTPRMIELEERYARGLIRGLGLRNHPALALVEVSNESSLLAAWRRREWHAAVPRAYEPLLREQWNRWAVKQYGSAAAACKAWDGCPDASAPLDLPMPGDEAIVPGALGQLQEKVSRRARELAQRWWGASAAAGGSDAAPTGRVLRTQDFLRFLADTDRAYYERMRRAVQEETDTRVPVSGTQMDYGGALNHDASTGMDWLDTHFYADHPDFPGNDFNPLNWRIRDASPAAPPWLDRMLVMSYWRDAGKPFVASEISVPFPNRQGGMGTPLIAAFAAQQDWDGLFLFDYADGDTWADVPAGFTLSGDWGRYAMVGQSAQLFRSPLVASLPPAPPLSLPLSGRLAINASEDRWAMDSVLDARTGVRPEMALQRQISVSPRATAWQPVAPAPAATPAFESDRTRGTLLLRSPQARGFFGAVGAGRSLGDATAQLTLRVAGAGPKEARGMASVLLTSLDGKPIADARQLLVSVSGAVRGTQPASMPRRPVDLVPYNGDREFWTFERDPASPGQPSGSREATGPVWVERVAAELRFATTARSATVYPLDGSGRRMAALRADQVRIEAGQLRVPLQVEAAQASLWYEVVAQ